MKRKRLFCGGNQVYYLNGPREVYSCGRGEDGELARDKTIEDPKLFPHLIKQIKKDVIWIAGGVFHSLFLYSDGTVEGAGSNNNYQLGQIKPKRDIEKRHLLRLLKIPEKICCISAGEYHSIFLSEDRMKLYACGSNDFGQCCTKRFKTEKKIVKSKGFYTGGERVKSIHSGWNHCFALTYSGKVYGWGKNNDRQLGLSLDNRIGDKNRTFFLDSLKDEEVVDIKGGSYHTHFLTKKGNVYAVGWNAHCQLGFDHRNNVYDILKLDVLSACGRVKLMTVGSYHSIFVLSSNVMKSCGSNDHYQAGSKTHNAKIANFLKDSSNLKIKLKPEDVGKNIKEIESMYWSSVLLLENGSIYAIGDNGKGQLGTGDEKDSIYFQKIKMKLKVFSILKIRSSSKKYYDCKIICK